MTTEQFVYWINGYFEIANPKTLGEKEIQVIKDHLALVLKKETPNRNQDDLAKTLGELLKTPQIDRTPSPPFGPYNPKDLIVTC